MKIKVSHLLFLLFFVNSHFAISQDISLYEQFNGRYDFLFIGNSMNIFENGTGNPCEILTTSTANLSLNPNDVVQKAYLYWAGSGTGDFDVKLNGQNITAARTFTVTQLSTNLPFFSAFADVSGIVIANGNTDYTISDLDLTAIIPNYCNNATNFAGWAIVIIYANQNLPLNQVNIYDGLQRVPDQIDISLNNLNVIDNVGSKIAFVAWEGDRSIAEGERLTINDSIVSNPPLNPANNAFNGTNSFIGSDSLFNMDLDVYDIENYIQIGNESANIRLTSSRDFVMINAVVTKLNSELPDATISIDSVALQCESRVITVDYTVYNVNSTQNLPGGVPIAIYANGEFIAYAETIQPILINQSSSDQITFVLPLGIPDDFELIFEVDSDGNGNQIITELVETNNTATNLVKLLTPPAVNLLPDVIACNEGLSKATFDFSSYETLVQVENNNKVAFYENLADAENQNGEILNTSDYVAEMTPKPILIRLEDENGCVSYTSFLLIAQNCPPTIYNFISANSDGKNDSFTIKGLRDIFLNFKLSVYNRWGNLIWTGTNNSADWDGIANHGFIPFNGNSSDGTYYYILELNDPDYPKPLQGSLYLTKP